MVKQQINSITAIRISCAVLFLTFTFIYLYSYQADVLAMAQHVLSEGKTHYNATVGALLITSVLYLLHVAVMAVTRLVSRSHALTYFPSLLLLAVLTDVSPDIDRGFTSGHWLWLCPLLLVLWTGAVWVARQIQPYESDSFSYGLFSRTVWINVVTMTVMMTIVGLVGTSNDVFHYRMTAERRISGKDYEGALRVGSKSPATDSSLTMLRIYALAAQGKLPERLFEYPLVGGSAAMRPNGTTVKMMLHDDTQLRLVRRTTPDYRMCGYLLDRNLEAFARELVIRYDLRRLPKHYREAMTLYCHTRSNPIAVYNDPATGADYHDYREMEKKYSNPQERQTALRDAFGKTYWYYFDYPGK